jgi:MFS family permease
MRLFADDFASVFWVAVVPAFAALALMLFVVHEPARPAGLRKVRNPLSRRELAGLGAIYWWVFALARFSEAFLILRAEGMGLSLMFVPLVLVVLNVAYALSAYPVGALSDGMNRIMRLIIGLLLLVAADLALAFAPGLWGILGGVVLWGLHMGFTQGILATLIADSAPPELRGTAFGMFNLVTGGALLAASVIAGFLWDAFGAPWTFVAGAGFAVVTIAGSIPLHRRLKGPDNGTRSEGHHSPKPSRDQRS